MITYFCSFYLLSLVFTSDRNIIIYVKCETNVDTSIRLTLTAFAYAGSIFTEQKRCTSVASENQALVSPWSIVWFSNGKTGVTRFAHY